VNKRVLGALFGMLFLIGCTSNQSDEQQKSVSQKVLKPVIAHQCQAELVQSKVWKASSLFLSADTQKQIKDQACECVSEHALDDVSTTTMLKATISKETKNELVRQAVLNSLSGCLQDTLKTL
jgi:hypothetical protein